MLLLWSCSGITCCLIVLGVYCDPHLRLHSWYSQRLWPYTDEDTQSKESIEAFNITSNVNYTKPWDYRISVESENLTDSFMKSTKAARTHAEEQRMWAPVALLSTVLFLYNIGLGSVPFVLVSELFSINVSIFGIKLYLFIFDCVFGDQNGKAEGYARSYPARVN